MKGQRWYDVPACAAHVTLTVQERDQRSGPSGGSQDGGRGSPRADEPSAGPLRAGLPDGPLTAATGMRGREHFERVRDVMVKTFGLEEEQVTPGGASRRRPGPGQPRLGRARRHPGARDWTGDQRRRREGHPYRRGHPGSGRPAGDQGMNVLLTCIGLSYPFVISAGVTLGRPRLAVVIVGLVLLVFGALAWRSGFRGDAAGRLAEAALMMVFLVVAVIVNEAHVFRLGPALANVAMLLSFGRTLRGGPSMVESIARVRRRELPRESRRVLLAAHAAVVRLLRPERRVHRVAGLLCESRLVDALHGSARVSAGRRPLRGGAGVSTSSLRGGGRLRSGHAPAAYAVSSAEPARRATGRFRG